MRRILLFCCGLVSGLVALAILWNSAHLFGHEEHWFSPGFTRLVGLAVIAEGLVAALTAFWCFGSAVGERAALPICGTIFLLAALGLAGQAERDSGTVYVMEEMPGSFSTDLSDAFHQRMWTDRTFTVLWTVVGGVLLIAPLLLRGKQIDLRLNGTGCSLAIVGLLVSALGALLWVGNGLTGEGASRDLSLAGHLGVLGGAVLAVGGSAFAVIGRKRD